MIDHVQMPIDHSRLLSFSLNRHGAKKDIRQGQSMQDPRACEVVGDWWFPICSPNDTKPPLPRFGSWGYHKWRGFPDWDILLRSLRDLQSKGHSHWPWYGAGKGMCCGWMEEGILAGDRSCVRFSVLWGWCIEEAWPSPCVLRYCILGVSIFGKSLTEATQIDYRKEREICTRFRSPP